MYTVYLFSYAFKNIAKQGPRVGRGGIDVTPSNEREAPRPPPGLEGSTAEGHGRNSTSDGIVKPSPGLTSNMESAEPSRDVQYLQSSSSGNAHEHLPGSATRAKKREARKRNPAWRTKEESAALVAKHTGEAPGPGELPRETGHDIGLGSPVPLSREAVSIITRLRNQKVLSYFTRSLSSLTYADLGRGRRLGSMAGCCFPSKGCSFPRRHRTSVC